MSERPHEQQPTEGELPPRREGEPDLPPRIYVASLADYNAGRLHGVWMDASRPVEELQADISAMLERSPEPIAEEWAIHDYDGFYDVRLSEYESLEVVAALAKGIWEAGAAFAAWASLAGNDLDTLHRFEDAFLGTWDRVEDYAEELLDGIGAICELDKLDGWLRPYVKLDIEGFARDLQLGGDITTVEDRGKVHIFDGRA